MGHLVTDASVDAVGFEKMRQDRVPADRAAIMYQRRIVEVGGTEEILRATLGRPGSCRMLFQVQKSLKPVRCHGITVAGWTRETASAQPLHSGASRAHNSPSEHRRRGRRAARWRTASWCHNARSSSTRARRVLSTRRRPARMRVIMPAIIDQAGRQFNVDEADGISRRHRFQGCLGIDAA
jgi:hypothetical protein